MRASGIWHLPLYLHRSQSSKLAQTLCCAFAILLLLQMCMHEFFACTPQPPKTFNSTEQCMLPVQDIDPGPGDAGPVQLPPGEQVMTQHVVLHPSVLQMLQEHTAFLHQQGKPACHSSISVTMPAQYKYCCSCKVCFLRAMCLSNV